MLLLLPLSAAAAAAAAHRCPRVLLDRVERELAAALGGLAGLGFGEGLRAVPG